MEKYKARPTDMGSYSSRNARGCRSSASASRFSMVSPYILLWIFYSYIHLSYGIFPKFHAFCNRVPYHRLGSNLAAGHGNIPEDVTVVHVHYSASSSNTRGVNSSFGTSDRCIYLSGSVSSRSTMSKLCLGRNQHGVLMPGNRHRGKVHHHNALLAHFLHLHRFNQGQPGPQSLWPVSRPCRSHPMRRRTSSRPPPRGTR